MHEIRPIGTTWEAPAMTLFSYLVTFVNSYSGRKVALVRHWRWTQNVYCLCRYSIGLCADDAQGSIDYSCKHFKNASGTQVTTNFTRRKEVHSMLTSFYELIGKAVLSSSLTRAGQCLQPAVCTMLSPNAPRSIRETQLSLSLHFLAKWAAWTHLWHATVPPNLRQILNESP